MNFPEDKAPYEPSVEQLRVRRLKMALTRLHEMVPSPARDALIFDMDALIGRIQNSSQSRGVGGKTAS